jgi:hypothetical protein
MDMARARVPLFLPPPIQTIEIDGKPSEVIDSGVPPMISSREYPEKSKPIQSKKQTPKQESITFTNGSTHWNISRVPLVPLGVPLEPTALGIQGISLLDISSRICAFMQRNSICCTYHGKEARVDCRTFCGLKFVVQLWRQRDQESPERFTDEPIHPSGSSILEVQRRRGCCLMMRYVRKMLYQAVLTNNLNTVSPHGVWHQHAPKHHQALQRLLQSFPRRQEDIADTTPRCLDLLASQQYDCNRFGIELLLVLTNPGRSGTSEANEIAQALAFGAGNLGSRLRQMVLSIVSLSTGGLEELDEDGDVENVSSLEGASPGVFERRSQQLIYLKILCACLEIIMKEEQDYLCNDAVLLDLGSTFWAVTLSFLMLQLELCQKRQHEASLAAKCLRLLEKLQPGCLLLATDSMIVSKAIKAYKIGQHHHNDLEQETEKLLQRLNVIKASAQ